MRKYNSKCVIYFTLLLLIGVFIEMTKARNQNTTVPVNVGVIVDLEAERKGLSSIKMALSDFYGSHSHYKTRLVLNIRDSMQDVVGAASAALDLIKNVQVQAIIGPNTSMQADFVIDLGQKAQIPIISYSATNPSLLTSIKTPYFFRVAQDDSVQLNAIGAVIKAFGWRQAVPIYIDNQYGQGILPFLADTLQKIDTRIPYRCTLSPVSTDDQIVVELLKLMTMQTRVFIVHMPPFLGSRLFTKAKELGMMSEGYVWIITDGMADYLTSLDPSIIESMQGVIGIRPYVPMSKELESFRVRWKRHFLQENPGNTDFELSIFELWAYDAAIALAMAVEKTGAGNLSFREANTSSSTDLASLGVSLNGPALVQALSTTRFKGLAGDFLFVKGQLPPSAFQIINVIGDGTRELGFWTPKNGLIKKLSSPVAKTSTSKSNLAPVIWPGDSTFVPKGWEIPTNGKKLRIGVPVKEGYSEFVKVTRDSMSNATSVKGYCIDVFDAVVEALPYSLTYEYIPFAKPDGSTAGTYNNLVNQVYTGDFDAVVGDTTIIANRSFYVDFTLPYTPSGVSMFVPIKDNKSKNAWVFLKPLTWDLWVTSFCFFIFIGFAVWVLEHRINEDFRGPPSHQVGTAFWFSFSTMAFAQREKVMSNLARVVVIIWCFVVLILTQSYTASLTSLLTVQQLIPTVTDVHQLIKNGDNVGYLKGSFVPDILTSLGFDESNLKMYKSTEECNELFSKGRKNGGIAAAFDEIPYIKLFLAKYCSKYTMVEPTFQTGGFGFVFPRGSPLVPDISRAILDVTEGDKIKRIEKAWFGKQVPCPDASTSIASSSLSLKSFWGLFLIAGVASVFALIIFALVFFYQHRQIWLPNSDVSDSSSVWSRIINLVRIFDHKDLKSHTFRKGSEVHEIHSAMPSPSIYSIRTDFPEEHGSPFVGYGDTNPTPQQVVIDINELVESTSSHS
ncbi:glutamate receptor 2.7-like isoform X3 [Mercurialis annua]|uniref:glutamate receptor 2.7-like isoform X3 n=1 Tax=Mercurialis annua TaxID=3986 RepID=UPI00215EA522|nr:glutamate receptor 2.7-like isoform X3 [Mercurialis annua]